MKKLCHYTNIDTLALILKSKKIRFNSLSNVDDLEESKSFDCGNIGDSCLVSCWTDTLVENIPLWKMYSSDFCGCRIELEENFFDIQDELIKMKSLDNVLALTGISKRGGIVAIPNHFEQKVKYVKEFSEREYFKNDALNINILGREKAIEWAFQNEYRFCLYQLPINNKSIKTHARYSFDHYDLQIKENSMNNIIVRLGPKCNEGHIELVKALIKKYTTNGQAQYSSLRGKIK